MNIRETLNQNKIAVVAVVVVLVIVAASVLLWPSDQRGQYYTTDDGESWFEHETTVPPFSHMGSEAVQAMVYTCDGGKTKFVAYLMKYKDEASRDAAAEALAARQIPSTAGIVVKKPGDTEWVPMGVENMGPPTGDDHNLDLGTGGKSGAEITRVTCPEGGVPIRVNPGFEDLQ